MISQEWSPFPKGWLAPSPEEIDFDPAPGVLEEVEVCVRCSNGHDGGEGEYAPENAQIEVWACFVDELSHRPLVDFICALDGSNCGEGAEIIALEKLKAAVDKTIAKLRAQRKRYLRRRAKADE